LNKNEKKRKAFKLQCPLHQREDLLFSDEFHRSSESRVPLIVTGKLEEKSGSQFEYLKVYFVFCFVTRRAGIRIKVHFGRDTMSRDEAFQRTDFTS